MTSLRLWLAASPAACGALTLALCWPAPAQASPTFPAEVQQALNMPCVPQCTLCHRDVNGGIGTVVQPFGQAMLAAGLEAKHPELIGPALDFLDQASTDSDGDGRPDVDELREGSNPNQAGGGVLCATYGCSTHLARPATSGTAAMLFSLIAAWLLPRARRRRRAAIRADGASR